MPQGLCAEANTPFRGCRSQVTLGGGARETIYLQPPPHKPRRHCLSPGRLLRKLRSRKVGCKLPVSSSGERNHAFLEQEEATAVSTRPLEGHQLFQEGLSFRVMTLSSDRAGEGPVEMAEHTSECTPDLLQVAEAELNPQISSPRELHADFGTCKNAASSEQSRGHTLCKPSISKKQKAARDMKQAHAVQPWLAVVPLAACTPHFVSPRLWGTAKQQPPVLPAAFWGAQPCLHPPAAPSNLSRGGGRVGAAWLFGRAAFVRSWGRAGSECACGSPRSPCKDGDYRAGEQQARLPPRLQHKSSSFQLTLSTRQAAQGIMLEFARGEKKIRGRF